MNPVGIVANLVAIPLFAVVLWFGLTHGVLAAIGLDAAASFVAPLARLAAEALSAVVEWFAAWPGSTVAVGSPGPWTVALAYGALFGTRGGARVLLLSAVAALAVVGPRWSPARGTLEVVVLDVGHGAATVLHLPDGRTALYDAGSDREAIDRRVIEPYLARRGVSGIDTLFLSHGDADHCSGLEGLLDSRPPRRLVTTSRVLDRMPWLLAKGRERGFEVVAASRGRSFDLGGARAVVVAPGPGDEGSDNDLSMALLLEWEGRRILLSGDLEEAGIARLLESDPPRADVVVLPHHGEGLAGLGQLLSRTRPRWAIASAPAGGGDPSARDVCRRAGAALLETGEDGAVRVWLSASGVRVETHRR